mgnify:CR=1 FL=1
MSYCAFENTTNNLNQCLDLLSDVFNENDLTDFYNNLSSDYERRGFKKMFDKILVLTEFFDTFEEQIKNL